MEIYGRKPKISFTSKDGPGPNFRTEESKTILPEGLQSPAESGLPGHSAGGCCWISIFLMTPHPGFLLYK